MTKQEKYDDLIAKFLAGEILPAEQSELWTWMEASESNREYFDAMETLWNAAEPQTESFFETNWESSWNQVEAAIKPNEDAKIRPMYGRTFILRIASVLLIGLAFSTWYFMQGDVEPVWNQIQTAQAERTKVQLPDGSTVWLNSNSELRYEPDFKDRIVYLEGEGFFDVTHQDGTTFQIRSGEAVTTVLGTTFNVRAYPEEEAVSVSVVSGKVRVEKSEKTETAVLLEAGQSASLEKQAEAPVIDSEPEVNAPFWHTLKLRFDDQLIGEVVSQLENYYDTEVVFENPAIGECHYTGIFEAKSLDEILEVLAFTLRLEIVKQNESYLLRGAGCE